jgi:hypothetical protein
MIRPWIEFVLLVLVVLPVGFDEVRIESADRRAA